MVVTARSAGVEISRRDREIVDLALRKLGRARFDFSDALCALREATAQLIPDGRIYFLGTTSGPIFGSIISGIGIVESGTGIDLVRVSAGGGVRILERFGR